jgi:hypothetical protein
VSDIGRWTIINVALTSLLYSQFLKYVFRCAFVFSATAPFAYIQSAMLRSGKMENSDDLADLEDLV